MERALEGDETIALGMALGGVIVARDLDRALHRFGAGMTEEHEIRKLCSHSRAASLSPSGRLEQVRHVPPSCLLLQRRDEMRMAWPSAFTATPDVKSR